MAGSGWFATGEDARTDSLQWACSARKSEIRNAKGLSSALLASATMHALVFVLAWWFIGVEGDPPLLEERSVVVTLVSPISQLPISNSEEPVLDVEEAAKESVKPPETAPLTRKDPPLKPEKHVPRRDRRPQQKSTRPPKEARERLSHPPEPKKQDPESLEATRQDSASVASVPTPGLPGGPAEGIGFPEALSNRASTSPVCIRRPSPGYPYEARQKGWEGTVLVAALVDTSGTVRETRIEQRSGHPSLDRAAEEAVKEWRFRPGQAEGKGAAMWVRVPVTFRLR